jgi:hypothetical protein
MSRLEISASAKAGGVRFLDLYPKHAFRPQRRTRGSGEPPGVRDATLGGSSRYVVLSDPPSRIRVYRKAQRLRLSFPIAHGLQPREQGFRRFAYVTPRLSQYSSPWSSSVGLLRLTPTSFRAGVVVHQCRCGLGSPISGSTGTLAKKSPLVLLTMSPGFHPHRAGWSHAPRRSRHRRNTCRTSRPHGALRLGTPPSPPDCTAPQALGNSDGASVPSNHALTAASK